MVLLKSSLRVFDLVVCRFLELLCVYEEPICVARKLHAGRWAVVDKFSYFFVFEAHFNQVAKPDDALSFHAAFSLKKLTQKGIRDTLNAAALELYVLVAYKIYKF